MVAGAGVEEDKGGVIGAGKASLGQIVLKCPSLY